MKTIFKINDKLLRLLLIILVFCLSSKKSFSQSVIVQNPEEYIIIEAQENALNSLYKDEIKTQSSTSTIQNSIAIEFSQIKEYEKAYTKYLQDASTYASMLKASSSLIDDGVMSLNYLNLIFKETLSSSNASLSSFKISNLYKEAIKEMLLIYTFYNEEIAKGGKENMLSGYERSKLLMELEKNLNEFKKKLEKIYYSLKVKTLNNKFYNASKQNIKKEKSTLTKQALLKWKENSQN